MTAAGTSGPPATPTSHWYHQPVAWLGVLIFLASLAGCVWLIIASLRYDERALPGSGEQLLKMPLERVPEAGARPPDDSPLPEKGAAADGSGLAGHFGIDGAGIEGADLVGTDLVGAGLEKAGTRGSGLEESGLESGPGTNNP